MVPEGCSLLHAQRQRVGVHISPSTPLACVMLSVLWAHPSNSLSVLTGFQLDVFVLRCLSNSFAFFIALLKQVSLCSPG